MRNDPTPAIVEAAAFILRRLFDRATDLTRSYGQIESTVDDLAPWFTAAGLRAVPRAFGCTYGLTSKAATHSRILHKVADRKGRWERGEEIGRIARGHLG